MSQRTNPNKWNGRVREKSRWIPPTPPIQSFNFPKLCIRKIDAVSSNKLSGFKSALDKEMTIQEIKDTTMVPITDTKTLFLDPERQRWNKWHSIVQRRLNGEIVSMDELNLTEDEEAEYIMRLLCPCEWSTRFTLLSYTYNFAPDMDVEDSQSLFSDPESDNEDERGEDDDNVETYEAVKMRRKADMYT